MTKYKTKYIISAIALVCLGFWLRGFFIKSQSEHNHKPDSVSAEKKASQWTCSMHPQIKKPKPGPCPICNMDLIPLTTDDSNESQGMRQLSVSKNAAKLMDIEVAAVEKKFVTANLRMVGKVDYDETRLVNITAWIPGRLDRLFVDYTGIPVRKGDHLVSIYSPQLLSAQEELIQAVKAVKNIKNTSMHIMQQTTRSTLKAAREKLRLWGLKAQQIADIEKRSAPLDHMTIYAPASGIVIHKNAMEGMYVKQGTKIYTIADLSRVWVKLDAYESDLQWLRYGQTVEFTTIAYPGEIFTGTVSFIDPVLNAKTRTVKVRVNAANADGKLKPDMFVRAQVKTQIAAGAKVMDKALAGKWICPMHPDEIYNEPGKCSLCEMPLVTAESLGYVSDESVNTEKPLVIPVTAALITGTRAIVYVKIPNKTKPTFEGREIVLGPRAGDYYLVHSGLKQGELVVVNGNFKLDAELQIRAKPSMMTPKHSEHKGHTDNTAPGETAINETLKKQLDQMFTPYFAMQKALAADKPDKASTAKMQIKKALTQVDMGLFDKTTHMLWMKNAKSLNKILNTTAKEDLVLLRENFYQISQIMIKLTKALGPLGASNVYQMHCPMAFDNTGASWLQNSNDLANPYFGETMLKCGSIEKEF